MGSLARALTALLPLALLIAACAGEEAPAEADIAVELRDFSISLAAETLSPGEAVISVRNRGSTAHDLIILRTEREADSLPVVGAQASEEGRVAATRTLPPGTSARLTVDLQPGNYVWICNVPAHYTLGMRTKVVIR
jgi:uncharacterized cupredoxin-like copper-binding protein